jgi:competence protein ComEC
VTNFHNMGNYYSSFIRRQYHTKERLGESQLQRTLFGKTGQEHSIHQGTAKERANQEGKRARLEHTKPHYTPLTCLHPPGERTTPEHPIPWKDVALEPFLIGERARPERPIHESTMKNRRDKLFFCLSLPFMLGIMLGRYVVTKSVTPAPDCPRPLLESIETSLCFGRSGISGGFGSRFLILCLLVGIGTLVIYLRHLRRRPTHPYGQKRAPNERIYKKSKQIGILAMFFTVSCICGFSRYIAFCISGEGNIALALQGRAESRSAKVEVSAYDASRAEWGSQDEQAGSTAQISVSGEITSHKVEMSVSRCTLTKAATHSTPQWPAPVRRVQVIGQIRRVDGYRVSGRAAAFLNIRDDGYEREAGQKTHTGVRNTDILPGSNLILYGTLRKPKSSGNPGVTGERDWAEKLGVFWIVEATSWSNIQGTKETGKHQNDPLGKVIESPSLDSQPSQTGIRRIRLTALNTLAASLSALPRIYELAYIPGRIRANLLDKVSDSLPDDTSRFYCALLLGDRSGIDLETSQVLGEIGLSHVLALSGLHVSLVATGIKESLKYIKVLGTKFFGALLGGNRQRSKLENALLFSTRIDFAITTSCVLAYAVISGGAPSVIRASIMFLCAYGAPIIHRQRSSETALWFAAFSILAFTPQALFDPGFQLSFSATWGILGFHQRLRQAFPKWPAGLLMTVSSQIASLPILAGTFGRFSLVSFLANPILVPFIALLVNYGLFLIFLCTALPWAASALHYPASWGIAAFDHASHWLASLPLASVGIGRPHWLLFIAYYALLWSCSSPDEPCLEKSGDRKLRQGTPYDRDRLSALEFGFKRHSPDQNVQSRSPRYKGATTLKGTFYFFVLLGLFWLSHGLAQPAPGVMEIKYFDVDQGDAALIRTREITILIDTGPAKAVRGRGVAELLRSEGVGHIDYLILSHGHEDHIGAAESILENHAVKTLFIPSAQANYEEFQPVLDAAERRRTRVGYLKTGDSFRLGSKWTTVNGFVHKVNTPVMTVLHPPCDSERFPNHKTHNISDSDIDERDKDQSNRPIYFKDSALLNETSLVFCLEYGHHHLLWTGDIGKDQEKAILSNWDIHLRNGFQKVTWDLDGEKQEKEPNGFLALKVAHHGSPESTSDQFMDVVMPKLAIIQVGKNTFGHPSCEVISGLRSRNALVFRTDQNGMVTLRTDGNRWRLWTWRPTV